MDHFIRFQTQNWSNFWPKCDFLNYRFEGDTLHGKVIYWIPLVTNIKVTDAIIIILYGGRHKSINFNFCLFLRIKSSISKINSSHSIGWNTTRDEIIEERKIILSSDRARHAARYIRKINISRSPRFKNLKCDHSTRLDIHWI